MRFSRCATLAAALTCFLIVQVLPARSDPTVLVRTQYLKTARAAANHVLVIVKPTVDNSRARKLHQALGGKVLRVISHTGLEIVECPPGASVEAMVKAYSACPEVAVAEPDLVCEPCAIVPQVSTLGIMPNDPLFSSLYGLTNIQAPQAWGLHTGSPSVVVAVIDSGIDLRHEDLATRIWHNVNEIPGNGLDDDHNGYADDVCGWDYADNDANPDAADAQGRGSAHGTHVAGIIGAAANNGRGVTGLDWGATLMPLRVFSASQGALTSSVCEAMTYAVDNGAKVINLSLRGSYSSVWQPAVDYAYGKGVVIVCAAGNDGAEITTDPATWWSPICNDGAAGQNEVLGVTAVNQNNSKPGLSNYSNTRHFCDVAAPGVNIVSTVWPSSYASMTGTSMSTAYVSGLASLIRGQSPQLSNAQVMSRIISTCGNIDAANPSYVGKLGAGRINALRALGGADAGPVMVAGVDVDDDGIGDSQGNGDGICNPGERVELHVRLKNLGTGSLGAVTGTLTAVTTTLAMPVARQSFGIIAPGTVGASQRSYVITVPSDLAGATKLSLSLLVSAANGGPYALPFDLRCFQNKTNSPPSKPTVVAISPPAPRPTSLLTAQAGGAVDPDPGDSLTYQYEWLCSHDQGHSWVAADPVISVQSGGGLIPGEQWKARARSSDGKASSEWVESPPVKVIGMLLSCTPAQGATDVPRATPVTLLLRWAVDERSFSQHLHVRDASGREVPGALVWPTSGTQAQLVPKAPLAPDSTYAVAIDAGVQLATGGKIGWPEGYSFTTRPGPAIISSGPQTPANTHSPIVVLWDQPMQRLTAQNAFALEPAVSGSFTWLGKKMTFTPQAALADNQEYTVNIGAKARSAAGVELGRKFSWSFRLTSPSASATLTGLDASCHSGRLNVNLVLTAAADLQGRVVNLAGREVASLGTRALPSGAHAMAWDLRSSSGTRLPGGTYMLELQVLGQSGTRSNRLLPLTVQ